MCIQITGSYQNIIKHVNESHAYSTGLNFKWHKDILNPCDIHYSYLNHLHLCEPETFYFSNQNDAADIYRSKYVITNCYPSYVYSYLQ